MRITRARRAALVLLAGVVVLWPALLWAHAHLTKSDPAAKAQLSVAPSDIRLWFSEAPELALSTITLKDSAGTAYPLGAVMRDSSKLGISAHIDRPLEPGRYTVGWRIASSDGHPVSGSYTFVVVPRSEMAADTIPEAQPVVETPKGSEIGPSAESLAHIASRFATFVALLAMIGAVSFKLGVMDRVPGLADETRMDAHARLSRFTLGAALVLLLAATARLGLQREIVSDPSHLVHLQRLAADTGWGNAWLLQVAAAIVLAIAAWMGRRGSSGAWTVAALFAVALAMSPAFGGHAGAAEAARGLALVTDGLHVLGAAGWLGGLACVMIVGVPATAHAREERWTAIASMVNAFSPVALACAGIVLLTGFVSAWLRLGALPPLWTSTYGRVLLLKLGLLVGVAATAAYNWRRLKPTLGTGESTGRLKKFASMELAVGIVVIAVTAVLVALPTPLDS